MEQPDTGFTGVVWEARPADRLARELTTGPGSVPLLEAAAAWTELAASLGAAVDDYDRIRSEIDDHWRSDTSAAVVEKISTMRTWLADAAAAAARNAVQVTGQAAAFEVARLAMPHRSEIAAVQAALQAVQTAGTALGAPLAGAAADISADHGLMQDSAARVMRSYESATEPLAQPWDQDSPPELTSGAALAAETTGAQSIWPTMPVLPATPAMPDFTALNLPLSGTRVQVVADAAPDETVPESIETTEHTVVQPVSNSAQPVPGAPGVAGAYEDEEVAVRSGIADRLGDDIPFDAGFAAAPPVLGGIAGKTAVAP